MKCVQRDEKDSEEEFVQTLRKFGCTGTVHPKADYCVDPDKKLKDAYVPPEPTGEPTTSPTTAEPTEPPTAEAEKRPRRWTDVMPGDILTTLIEEQEVVESEVVVDMTGSGSTNTVSGVPKPSIPQTMKMMAAMERDPFKFTEMPSAMPSDAPSFSPTDFPTLSPSTSPTFGPTKDPYPPKSIPKDPEGAYFDYSDDSDRGPRKWGSNLKGEKMDQADYWDEFDEYIKPDLQENMCDYNDKTARQSPIDVSFDKATSQCFEYHQIRSKPGEWGITHPKVEKQILPNKLRFVYDRKFEGGFGGADTNDMVKGASADMPKQWGYQLPVLHVDVKIPSEHTMEGKRYAAEYQIFMILNRTDKKRGAPAVSVLFDIHPEEEDNHRIQQMIDEFQKVYDADMAECEGFRRKQRRLGAWADNTLGARIASRIAEDFHQSTVLDEPEEMEAEFQENLGNLRRKAQEYRKWNPWHETIVTSPWFYGYEGSLTEPPCSEFVEWRVILEPALISTRQLAQMKNILFNHVNGKCERTSVHSSENGVARPTQPLNGRALYQCMCRDFITDKDRQWYGENRCKWTERDQFGFDKEKYTYEWYQSTHKYMSIEEYWKDFGKPDWAK